VKVQEGGSKGVFIMSLGYRFSDGVIAESLKNSSRLEAQNRLTITSTIPSKWLQREFFFKVSYAASYLPTVPTLELYWH